MVELHGITKRFPGVVANKDIELTVHRGTVHAIVGENGAGKSTLMKILYGVQQPDEGTISVEGTVRALKSPADAIDAGIGMVFQHFQLADNFTVLENVVLGAEKLHGIGDAARRSIREISDAYGLDIDPDVLVEDLGVGAQQRIEILKVLYRGARIIILDEPTAVLVPQEVEELFDNLRELKAEGLTVIFISHKLDEVLSVADAITVIRRGTTVAEVLSQGRHRPRPRRAHGRLRAAVAEHRGVDRHRDAPARHRGHLPRQPTRRAPPAERHRTHHSRRRDRRDRRRRGQRPGRAGRGDHGDPRALDPVASCSATWISPPGRPESSGRPASATSPRTGTATGCCSRHRCGRTSSSATRPSRSTPPGRAAR